jgi:hypothetical protein
MAEEIWEVIPQGLKPLVIPAHFGTAKEVAEKGIVGGEMDPAGASMRRLVLSRFLSLHLFFPYWRFCFCCCSCCCLWFVLCGFISGFYTHSLGARGTGEPYGSGSELGA